MTIYKGFSTYNRVKKYRLTDFELVKQDLFNHFYIRKGEKLMNPNFGTIIWNLLFEPLTEEVKTTIYEDIKKIVNYDPRLEVDDITVTQYEHGLQIAINLVYIPDDQRDILVMNFDKNNQSLSVIQ